MWLYLSFADDIKVVFHSSLVNYVFTICIICLYEKTKNRRRQVKAGKVLQKVQIVNGLHVWTCNPDSVRSTSEELTSFTSSEIFMMTSSGNDCRRGRLHTHKADIEKCQVLQRAISFTVCKNNIVFIQ